MSWWDYGHWITEIAHRIPNANPHQRGAVDAATFLIARDEEAGKKILDRLGSRYVVIDMAMAVPLQGSGEDLGKFYAYALWTGDTLANYYEPYYRRNKGRLERALLYYPAYYESMCARLFNFAGKEWTPRNSTAVVSWVEHSGLKEIVSEQIFGSYEEARTFMARQTGANWRIVGKDPFVSPVPLKKLEHFERVYHSDTWAAKFADDEPVAYMVEIYRYKP
jgi:dolichyl-diphosphooligosaccharide--protein glycosyltransferase